MINVTCPCCQGAQHLVVDDPANGPIKLYCCHCEGKGTVPAEVPREDNGPDGRPEHLIVTAHSPPGLKRGELSRAVKRDHLLGLRVAPDDIEKIIAEIYP